MGKTLQLIIRMIFPPLLRSRTLNILNDFLTDVLRLPELAKPKKVHRQLKGWPVPATVCHGVPTQGTSKEAAIHGGI